MDSAGEMCTESGEESAMGPGPQRVRLVLGRGRLVGWFLGVLGHFGGFVWLLSKPKGNKMAILKWKSREEEPSKSLPAC